MRKRVPFALVLALAVSIAVFAFAQNAMTLIAADGVKLAGNFVDTGKPGSKGLILLHMMGGTWRDWDAFAELAKQRGFCSVAVTLRGHGESVWTTNGTHLNRNNFSDKQFVEMSNDVEAAYQYLIKQPSVDRNRIGIVGASIGANLAVNYAADNPDRIRSVVLLSPGLRYRGIGTEAAVKKYRGGMLFYAAHADEYSARSVAALSKLAEERGKAFYFNGGEHGTRLLSKHPNLSSEIIDWLKANI